MQSVLIKFLTMNCPTLCLVNGHAIAGGVIIAAAHDYRAMSSKASLQLSEFSVGLPFLTGYAKLLENCLGKHAYSQCVYGKKISSAEAVSLEIVQQEYTELAQVESIVADFAREFVPRSIDRVQIG